MSIVKPFKGLRVKPEFAREVACPPYDVLSTREAREIVKRFPLSFLRVNKSELEFDDSVNPYSEEVYSRAKANLDGLVEEGLMVRDAKPCFYIDRLTMDGRSQTGLMALTSVEEYDQGKIKKHEHTRPEKVKDRADHITYLNAQVGPVLTTFRYDVQIDLILKKITSNPALTDFVAEDGIQHEFWVVNDDDLIARITAAFAKLPCLYIADGHHRSQSASEVCSRLKSKNPHHTGQESYNFFLNVLFPDNELRIMPYNRVIRDLNGMTIEQILDRASRKFDIFPNDKEINPSQPHIFGLYCQGKWYQMKSEPGSFDANNPTGSIDAAILAENFIAPIMGITNPKTDKRIDFVGGIRGTKELVKLVDSGEFKIAFSLYPTSIEQLLKVADAGQVMPPKSTWFEPKLRDGLAVYLLTD